MDRARGNATLFISLDQRAPVILTITVGLFGSVKTVSATSMIHDPCFPIRSTVVKGIGRFGNFGFLLVCW